MLLSPNTQSQGRHISVTIRTTSEKAPIKSSRHTSHQTFTTPSLSPFYTKSTNYKTYNDSSSSQNLTWTQSYSQSKILQQSECNRCTKRPGNIEPDENICHVHFKPNKIRRHPCKQKYRGIHNDGSLFRKRDEYFRTRLPSIVVPGFGSIRNTILMFCCGTLCFSPVGTVPQQKSQSLYNPKIPS